MTLWELKLHNKFYLSRTTLAPITSEFRRGILVLFMCKVGKEVLAVAAAVSQEEALEEMIIMGDGVRMVRGIIRILAARQEEGYPRILAAVQEEAVAEAVLGVDMEVVLRDMVASEASVVLVEVKEVRSAISAVHGPRMAAAVHLEAAAVVANQEEALALRLFSPVTTIARLTQRFQRCQIPSYQH